jgi:hypothetical protein
MDLKSLPTTASAVKAGAGFCTLAGHTANTVIAIATSSSTTSPNLAISRSRSFSRLLRSFCAACKCNYKQVYFFFNKSKITRNLYASFSRLRAGQGCGDKSVRLLPYRFVQDHHVAGALGGSARLERGALLTPDKKDN